MWRQTNHLGPYTLTRLLEGKLAASKGRVVMVASIMHRTTRLKDPRVFLTDWRAGFYDSTKLANVLCGYELQRRLGPHGVQVRATAGRVGLEGRSGQAGGVVGSRVEVEEVHQIEGPAREQRAVRGGH